MQKNEKYQVISTKVTPRAKLILDRLARKSGMEIYELLQMCCDCLVRYTSDQFNLTPDLEQMMGLFEHMVGWAGALNVADPTVKPHIGEAVYFLSADGKKGTRAVHVNRPFFGDWQQNFNVVQIIDRVLELTVPERYKKLRLLAAEMDCKSVLELIDAIIERWGIETLDADEVRKSFEDCNRGDNNQPVEYGQRTKRKKRHDIEGPQPEAIHFDPDDQPDLPELRPFDPDKDAIGI